MLKSNPEFPDFLPKTVLQYWRVKLRYWKCILSMQRVQFFAATHT